MKLDVEESKRAVVHLDMQEEEIVFLRNVVKFYRNSGKDSAESQAAAERFIAKTEGIKVRIQDASELFK
jgi:hypothetical protein